MRKLFFALVSTAVAVIVVLLVELVNQLRIKSEIIRCYSIEECLAKSMVLVERTLVIAVLFVALLLVIASVVILVNLFLHKEVIKSRTE